ncbi:MAG TPA: proton-conducting transporter membrane subunit [bacterium]|nr:proton-conducting transporter membrane subunit [bacterium]
MILLVVIVPVLASLAAMAVRHTRARRALLILVATAHAALTAGAWVVRPEPALGGWMQLDALGLIFLSIISALFLAAAVYAAAYLAREQVGTRQDFEESFLFVNEPEAVFVGCLLLFLGTMSLVTVSHNFGMLWVAIEATTLSSAPLIYFHRHHRSLEATWKYLLICSVGIALALLGTFFLASAASASPERGIPLVLGELLAHSGALDLPWLKVAFLFMLVGYGTKMGLAPLHSWLPDAHSEAPSVVSALLSGALLNCAFLGILRIGQVLNAAGAAEFGQGLLLVFGVISVVFATVFIVSQLDFKRMLAYSSIEHMGIMAIGVGVGGLGTFGSLLHAVNHSLTKAMLFLVAGNILARYRTKSTKLVNGVLAELPGSGVLWMAGLLAITGTPPFGLFQSELTILRAAFGSGRYVVAVLLLLALVAIFVAMAAIMTRMLYGQAREGSAPSPGEAAAAVVPPAVLCMAVLILGLYLPPALNGLLREAANLLDVRL